MQRVRMEYKRRYKRSRVASVDSRAVHRIVRMLVEDEQRGPVGRSGASMIEFSRYTHGT